MRGKSEIIAVDWLKLAHLDIDSPVKSTPSRAKQEASQESPRTDVPVPTVQHTKSGRI